MNHLRTSAQYMSAQIRLRAGVVVTATLLIVASILAPMSAYAAGSATLDLSASAASAVEQSNFTITVSTTASVQVNTTETYLTYDASKVSLVGSPDYTSSPFNSDGPSSTSGTGYILMNRIVLSAGQSGTLFITRLTFKALGNSGSVAFNITKAQSDVHESASPNADILTSVSGANVALTAIPAAAPAAAPSTGSPKVNPTPPKSGTPAAPTTPVKLTPATSLTPDPGTLPAAQPATANITPTKVSVITPKKKSMILPITIAVAAVAVLAVLSTVGRTFLIKRRNNGLRFGGYVAGSVPVTPVAPKVQPEPTTVTPTPTPTQVIPISVPTPSQDPAVSNGQSVGTVITPTTPSDPPSKSNDDPTV